MLFQVSILTAFAQGLLSFFSPCVLPLVPAYLSYLGVSMAGTAGKKGLLLRNAALYVLGFSVVFVAMGATATALGTFLRAHDDSIRIVSGALLIVFGAVMLFPLPLLQRERRLPMGGRGMGAVTAVLMGMAFAFGWSPCIGPVLASVLMMAAASASMWQGTALLCVYSLGLGVPFLLMALFLRALQRPLQALKKHMGLVRRISAALLIVVGVLMVTDTFMLLASLG